MSVVVPVYRNEESLPELVAALTRVADRATLEHGVTLEAVFVVDGSPDQSHRLLTQLLPAVRLHSRLVLLSRNFGSFAAIRAGFGVADGDYFCVLAADLQEPPELVLDFLAALREADCDVAVGRRTQREEPMRTAVPASLFWRLYRGLVNREIPVGGVDVFGCSRRVRDHLLAMQEANSSLVALVFWLGYPRLEVPYARRARPYGRSAWSFRRKLRYLLDSVFAFTDLPIAALTVVGAAGVLIASVLAVVTIVARLVGGIAVPGYAALIIAVAFFGALNLFGLGLVGAYAWRAYENTKGRPPSVVRSSEVFSALPQRAAEIKADSVDVGEQP